MNKQRRSRALWVRHMHSINIVVSARGLKNVYCILGLEI